MEFNSVFKGLMASAGTSLSPSDDASGNNNLNVVLSVVC